jgi:hypothetical protein
MISSFLQPTFSFNMNVDLFARSFLAYVTFERFDIGIYIILLKMKAMKVVRLAEDRHDTYEPKSSGNRSRLSGFNLKILKR